MKKITISYENKSLYKGDVVELTPLGVGVECHFEMIKQLRTSNGKFKVLDFDLKNDNLGLKGEIFVHSMRRVKKDCCLICFRFFKPDETFLMSLKGMLSKNTNRPKVLTKLSKAQCIENTAPVSATTEYEFKEPTSLRA